MMYIYIYRTIYIRIYTHNIYICTHNIHIHIMYTVSYDRCISNHTSHLLIKPRCNQLCYGSSTWMRSKWMRSSSVITLLLVLWKWYKLMTLLVAWICLKMLEALSSLIEISSDLKHLQVTSILYQAMMLAFPTWTFWPGSVSRKSCGSWHLSIWIQDA